MKIFYWCPYISNVATINAVLNSIESINKYSKNGLQPYLINAVGEWNLKKNILDEKKIKVINFYNRNLMQYLPKLGFIQSRFTYFIIFFLTVFKLHKIIKEKKPDYIVVHLITFIPLFLLSVFNYETKFILRVSGYPKLNYIREIFWKIISYKISLITVPTVSTLNLLISKKIFTEDKIFYLPDPVLKIEDIQKKYNENFLIKNQLSKKNSLISIGRLTKQKNFVFLIKKFNEIKKKYNN